MNRISRPRRDALKAAASTALLPAFGGSALAQPATATRPKVLRYAFRTLAELAVFFSLCALFAVVALGFFGFFD